MVIKIICIFIGTQFILSALGKTKDLKTFKSILNSYKVPKLISSKKAIQAIIAFEFVLGLFFLSLFQTLSLIAVVGAILFILMTVVLILNRWMNGEKKFRCGCGDNLEQESNALFLIFRNLIYLGLLIGVLANLHLINNFLTKDLLFIYLTGFGLVAVLRICKAIYNALNYIKEWKMVG